MTRVCGLGIFIIGAVGAGCISLPFHRVNPSLLSGPAVAQTIDAVIDAQLRSDDPTLSISPSQCPNPLDIGSTPTPTCTMTVSGVPLRVFVTPNGPPPGYNVRLRGGVFERRIVERSVAEEAEQAIGGHLRASCPIAVIIVAPDGTSFVCRITGARQPASMTVRADSSGKLTTTLNSKNKRQMSALDKLLKRAVDSHTKGQQTTIDGSTVSEFIDNELSDEWRIVHGGRNAWGRVRCPALLDVTGARHAHCTAEFDGQTVHFDFWIEGQNVRFIRTDAILDMQLIQRSGQQLLGQALATGGFSERALIECKGAYRVVPMPSDTYCDAMIGTRPARLRIHLLDTQGHYKMNVVFSSPSP